MRDIYGILRKPIVTEKRFEGKYKRFRFRMGKQRDWKKAVVTLKEGDRVDFFEGMR